MWFIYQFYHPGFSHAEKISYTTTLLPRVIFQNLPGGGLLELPAKIISLLAACVNSRGPISHGHKVARLTSAKINTHNWIRFHNHPGGLIEHF